MHLHHWKQTLPDSKQHVMLKHISPKKCELFPTLDYAFKIIMTYSHAYSGLFSYPVFELFPTLDYAFKIIMTYSGLFSYPVFVTI